MSIIFGIFAKKPKESMEKREIEGFEGYYVDNEGNVWSNKSGKLKKLKESYSDGYAFVGLYNNGKLHPKRIHRIVAETFIPNPDNKPCVDHINGNRTDNRVVNLRYCTIKENNSFPLARRHFSEASKGKPKSEEHRRKISEGHKGKKYKKTG